MSILNTNDPRVWLENKISTMEAELKQAQASSSSSEEFLMMNQYLLGKVREANQSTPNLLADEVQELEQRVIELRTTQEGAIRTVETLLPKLQVLKTLQRRESPRK